MKKIKTIFALICLLPLILLAQTLTVNNKGAAITVKSNTAMKISGNYLNKQNGRIKNSGTINLNGNWTKSSSNTVFTNTGGTVKFTGNDFPEIGGGTTTFNTLDIDTEVSLRVNTLVSQNLNFNSGYLYLTYYDLQMLGSAGITGTSPSQYIVTDEGSLIRNAGAAELEFPVGTAFEFAPVTLVNNSGNDEFAVNIFSDVLDNGTTGSTIADIEKTVKHTWVITDPDGSISNPDFDLNIFWNGSMEGNDFNRNNASVSLFNGATWQNLSAVGAFGSDPYFISQASVTGLGAFTVKSILLNFTLDMKAFLEGPFKTTEMSTDLNPALIPLNQPYDTAPWNYAGTESVTAIPNANVVDWVLVELHDATSAAEATPSTRLARQAAFILKDGSIVGTDGNSLLQFNVTVNNSLYAVLWHRNHLGIMSANPLTESGGVYSYDFTTNVNKAYQSGQKNLSGIAAMYGGDADANGIIDMADKDNDWINEAGKTGYYPGDLNMDSQVNNPDKNDIWFPNIGEVSQLPAPITWNCGETLIDDRDGQTYNTVQIGTQCWMAENLNIGTMINGSNDQTDNGTIEKYCYGNNASNCDTYGGLYQWNEMMQYVTTAGTQGICPEGWHLPTDAEWMILEEEVESTTGVDWNTTGFRGTDAGGNLKETGTSHWYNPNSGATNSSGFTGLPGGVRDTGGAFGNITVTADFWSSSVNGTDAWSRTIHYFSAQVGRYYQNWTYGFGVRCVRD